MPSSISYSDPQKAAAIEPPIPAPRPRPCPRSQQLLPQHQPLLVVPQVPNDSTTILQKSPTSAQGDQETYFSAVISPTSAGGGKMVAPLKGGLTLITLESNGDVNEGIAKSAAFSAEEDHNAEAEDDDEEEEEEEEEEMDEVEREKERVLLQQEDKSYSEWVSNKLYRMKHGFHRKLQQANDINDDDDNESSYIASTETPQDDGAQDVMNAVQELRLIHRPQTGNFLILVDQLRAMRKAAETLQSEDVAILSFALTTCECVFERHQRFDQILETDPSKEEAIKALYELVHASSKDTIALIQDWSTVYHTLQELVLRIRTITAALVNNSHHGRPTGKSPKSRRSLFGKKPLSSSATTAGSLANINLNASTATLAGGGGSRAAGSMMMTPQFSPEVLRHHHEVCANWSSQMRTFEQLARAYRSFADQVTTFTLINEIDTVRQYYDQVIRSTFEKAHEVFLNSRLLSQLHDQIDYSNLCKTLNKDMALTTREDRMEFPQFMPLFGKGKGLIEGRKVIKEGKLVEFVSSSGRSVGEGANAASVGGKKKNSAHPPPPPKEYRLIVTTDMIYMCEVVPPPSSAAHESSSKKLSTESRNALKAGGSILSLPATSSSSTVHYKPLKLCHEPVLVMDAQISSTPDVVHPPVIQKDMVMVCFYNDTTYILQAESSEVRDAWVECARTLNIEQPKPSASCREQDELVELQQQSGVGGVGNGSTSTLSAAATFVGSGIFKLGGGHGGSGSTVSGAGTGIGGVGGKTGKVSLLKRLKSLRRSTANLHTEDNGPIPEIHPDQLTLNDEEERARRMQLGQPSLWEVRRLPLDLGVIPPLEQPIPFRKRHLYDISVQIEDLTSGKSAPGEFGMGIEDRAAYFRDECALFAVLRPARLIPSHAIDRKRDDFFLCKKRMHRGEIHYVEPPYITDFYARSWLHPEMHIEFNPEARTVTIAKMYKITCSTIEIVGEFKKYHAWLMENARISPDNTFLCMDYRSKPLRVSKRIERAASSAPQTMSSVEETRILEGGRKYTELGECHMEFRRMSNAPDALSVGFYNPATKRDMAIGVMVFDKIKIKATASSLGLNALNALGATNGVIRVSPTEISLTMWQTDARTRPRFIKGQRVFETVKSKSLDVFKLSGPRDALDELEEFIRVKMGTDCKARDIPETFRLIEIAFQDQVLNASMDDESSTTDGEDNVFEASRAQLQRSGSKPRSVKSIKSPIDKVSSSSTTTPALSPLSKDDGRFDSDNKSVRSIKSVKSVKSVKENDDEVASILEEVEQDEDEDEEGEFGSNHPCEGYLATVLEEDEEEDSSASSSSNHRTGIHSKKASLSSSTATFRPKTRKALQEMLLQQEHAARQNSPHPTKIVSAALPQMDPSSFEVLSADGSMADYLSSRKSTPSSSSSSGYLSDNDEEEEKEEEIAAPTVADLTRFWAKTTNALIRSGSQSTIRSLESTVSNSSSSVSSTLASVHCNNTFAPSSSSAKNPSLSPIDSNLTTSTAPTDITPPTISTYTPPPPNHQPSELEAHVLALKSTASHSAIIAQLTEENQAQANVKDLVQATRYLSKHKIQISSGVLNGGVDEVLMGVAGGGGGGNEDEGQGVDMDPTMPVKDLKKRWEEIHRLGI
ncbi:hypothetical protein BGZ95_012093 [Linnemannia exigua]|uniref:PH domain-containing protein n=1 Tax=Linnemannia exigua TaxID=604196 RepID=A0AAD4H550_9FUNG|nr:hypothetical protein BGZ95_012093 [Linnemannia exigua]